MRVRAGGALITLANGSRQNVKLRAVVHATQSGEWGLVIMGLVVPDQAEPEPPLCNSNLALRRESRFRQTPLVTKVTSWHSDGFPPS